MNSQQTNCKNLWVLIRHFFVLLLLVFGIQSTTRSEITDPSFRLFQQNSGSVYSIAQQPDGKILVGGSFKTYGGETRQGIARLNLDGTIDYSFDSSNGINTENSNRITGIIPLANGKILIGGEFQSYSGIARRGIARLNRDGSLDVSFTASLNSGYLEKILFQTDGKILIGGNYDGVNGNNQPNFARLNSDGTVDTNFLMGTGANAQVQSIQLQPDGKILIAGDFYQYNRISRDGIARINSDGSLDPTLNTGNIDGQVYGILLQPDGKILVRGYFNAINGIQRVRLARINADGGVDSSFNPGAGPYGIILDFALQTDGKIIIAGTFTSYNNTVYNNLARLNTDGSLDSTFLSGTGFNSYVRSVLFQKDQRLLFGLNPLSSSYPNLRRLRKEGRPVFDFDGDGKSDVSVFRPGSGVWLLNQSQNGFTGVQFGVSTDKLVPADYDGDGKTDLAVYRSGTWYLLRSTSGFTGLAFGAPDDIPQPADFDGDGKTELVVWRPSNGTWYIYNLATNQFTAAQFGAETDKPVVGDYDGDNKADYAVFRPSNGTWYLNRSSSGFTGIQFGDTADKPVSADYDGDGKTDIAVYRQSNGTWYLNRSQAGFNGIQFGVATDFPVPADYDGDGKADTAVFRSGVWYLNQTTAGFTGIQFGSSSDKPVPYAFIF